MLRKAWLNEDKEVKEIKAQTVHYSAPNPYFQSYTGIGFLDSFIRNLSSRSSLHSECAGKLVLPAQSRTPVSLQAEMVKNLEEYKLQVSKVEITTFDGAELDGIEINPSEKKPSVHIVKFNGNGYLYEDDVLLQQMIDDASRLDANVIAFNYQGVGNSSKTPTCSQDLVNNGIAQVQRLLDGGVLPNKIVLDGLSLGGGVATLVAKYFHDKGIKLNLFNDRSFSSISNAAAHMLLQRELRPAVEYLFESTSSSVISFAGWQINAAEAYVSIPQKNKAYMFVTDDEKSYPGNQGDCIISEKASLHQALKTQPKKQGYFSQMTCHLFSGGHNALRKELALSSDKNINGENVFDSFVKRVTT